MKKRKNKSESVVTAANEGLIEFDAKLKELGRFAPVTGTLIAVNILLWIFMVVRGVHWLDPNGDSLKLWQANFGPLTTRGEGWRLITACFIHAGIVQLLVNQWALWQYGRWLERFFGHLGFALLYLITGFASSLVAVRWQPTLVLAGSTGPIAGLIGALGAFYWRVPRVVPKPALNQLRAGTFVFLAYNIGVEMYRERLDAAGFLSGLAVGFVGGLILSQPFVDHHRPRRWNRNSLLAALGLFVVLLAAFLPPVLPDAAVEFDEIQQAKHDVLKSFQKAYDDLREDRIDTTRFIDAMGRDVLPPWRVAERRLEEIDKRNVAGPAGEIIKLTLESMKTREQGWNLLVDSLLLDSDEGTQKAANEFAEAERLEDQAAEIAAKSALKHAEKH
jgi:rhomboid protease GluP